MWNSSKIFRKALWAKFFVRNSDKWSWPRLSRRGKNNTYSIWIKRGLETHAIDVATSFLGKRRADSRPDNRARVRAG